MHINSIGSQNPSGTMESVSVASCSSQGSTSRKKEVNSRKISHQDTGTREQSINVPRNDDSLRMTKGERPPQSLDERRDDHFAVSRPVWCQLPVPTTVRPHWYNNQNYLPRAYYLPSITGAPPPQRFQRSQSTKGYPYGFHRPTNRPRHDSGSLPWNAQGRRAEYTRHNISAPKISVRGNTVANGIPIQPFPSSSKKNATRIPHHTSRVVFPQNITIPKEISPSLNHPESERLTKRYNSDTRHRSRVVFPQNITIPKAISPSLNCPASERLTKRSNSIALDRSALPPTKKSKKGVVEEGFDKLDLLCSATLDLGPLQENPTGCSCPKSRCVALYCDCFKAGRRCDPIKCSCLNCLNTVNESGPQGARSRVSVSRRPNFYFNLVCNGFK